MSKFDRKICIGNIYALAKDRNIKIGDLEKEGGMSVGYLSRLSKEDSTSIPSIEFIASAAEQLGVSINALISIDFTSLTPTEAYLLEFVEKLISETEKDKLVWEKDSELELVNMCIDGAEVCHPLFYVDYDEPGFPQFVSKFEDTREIGGDGYVLQMTGNEALYLMRTKDAIAGIVDELYMVQRGSVHTLCESLGLFHALIKQLYATVAESCRHPKIRPSVMEAIDKFMAVHSEDDDDGELPF